MNKQTPIDWSQVIPGKTWLESPNGCQCRVDAVVGEDVWVYHKSKQDLRAVHRTWTKSSIAACKWQIREEWEDVTDECVLKWSGGCSSAAVVVHHEHIITNLKGEYKLKSFPNIRIYKRRPL